MPAPCTVRIFILFSLSRLCVLYVETLTGVLFLSFDLLGNIFVQFVFHLRPSPDHYYLLFVSFHSDQLLLLQIPQVFILGLQYIAALSLMVAPEMAPTSTNASANVTMNIRRTSHYVGNVHTAFPADAPKHIMTRCSTRFFSKLYQRCNSKQEHAELNCFDKNRI